MLDFGENLLIDSFVGVLRECRIERLENAEPPFSLGWTEGLFPQRLSSPALAATRAGSSVLGILDWMILGVGCVSGRME